MTDPLQPHHRERIRINRRSSWFGSKFGEGIALRYSSPRVGVPEKTVMAVLGPASDKSQLEEGDSMRLQLPKYGAGILFAALLIFVPTRASADSVTLTISSVSGTPGSTVTVDGTITNNSSDTVYLNSESYTLASGSFINGDPTDFFLNAPVSLAPDTSSGLIALFAFEIEPGTAAGSYSGNFLDIVGGGPSDLTDVLTSSGYSVTVLSSTVPEPGALILLSAGLLGLWLLRRNSLTALASSH